MSIKFGRIESTEKSFVEQTFHKNQTIHSGSDGTSHHFAKKDDYADPLEKVGLTTSGSHWAFVHGMFYLSGSTKVSESMPADIEKFDSIYHNFNQYNDLKPFHTNKFYETASVFYIPQQTFGERIKPGSFQLTARTGSFDNTTKQIIIKDDSNGNLYSSNAYHSQSAATSISSSDNYIGNVFYDLGVAVLTETASWSGSVNYTDVGRLDNTLEQTYKYWQLDFSSTTPIWTSQYTIKINSGDFNATMNNSSRGDLSGSDVSTMINVKNELTGSGWSPYFTQIQLFRNQTEEPVLHASLPRAIKMRDDVDLIITFRVDH